MKNKNVTIARVNTSKNKFAFLHHCPNCCYCADIKTETQIKKFYEV